MILRTSWRNSTAVLGEPRTSWQSFAFASCSYRLVMVVAISRNGLGSLDSCCPNVRTTLLFSSCCGEYLVILSSRRICIVCFSTSMHRSDREPIGIALHHSHLVNHGAVVDSTSHARVTAHNFLFMKSRNVRIIPVPTLK